MNKENKINEIVLREYINEVLLINESERADIALAGWRWWRQKFPRLFYSLLGFSGIGGLRRGCIQMGWDGWLCSRAAEEAIMSGALSMLMMSGTGGLLRHSRLALSRRASSREIIGSGMGTEMIEAGLSGLSATTAMFLAYEYFMTNPEDATKDRFIPRIPEAFWAYTGMDARATREKDEMAMFFAVVLSPGIMTLMGNVIGKVQNATVLKMVESVDTNGIVNIAGGAEEFTRLEGLISQAEIEIGELNARLLASWRSALAHPGRSNLHQLLTRLEGQLSRGEAVELTGDVLGIFQQTRNMPSASASEQEFVRQMQDWLEPDASGVFSQKQTNFINQLEARTEPVTGMAQRRVDETSLGDWNGRLAHAKETIEKLKELRNGMPMYEYLDLIPTPERRKFLGTLNHFITRMQRAMAGPSGRSRWIFTSDDIKHVGDAVGSGLWGKLSIDGIEHQMWYVANDQVGAFYKIKPRIGGRTSEWAPGLESWRSEMDRVVDKQVGRGEVRGQSLTTIDEIPYRREWRQTEVTNPAETPVPGGASVSGSVEISGTGVHPVAIPGVIIKNGDDYYVRVTAKDLDREMLNLPDNLRTNQGVVLSAGGVSLGNLVLSDSLMTDAVLNAPEETPEAAETYMDQVVQ